MGSTKVAVKRKNAPEAQQERHHEADGHDHAHDGMRVGAADDAYEVAADKAADSAVRRLAEGGQLGESGGGFGAMPSAPTIGAAGGTATADTSQRIGKARGAGKALPSELRGTMEKAFGGANFSGVRLHQGKEAASLSSKVGAHAFTVGKDVFLGGSMPDLGSREGQHTLAHELAHTLQPSGGARRLFGLGKKKSPADLKKEQDAKEAKEKEEREGKERHSSSLKATKDTTKANGKTFHTDNMTVAEKEKAEGNERAETAFGVGEMISGGGEGLGAANDINGMYGSLGNNQDDGGTSHGSGKLSDQQVSSHQLGSQGDQDKMAQAGVAFSGFGLIAGAAKLIQGWSTMKPEEKAEGVIGVVGAVSDTANNSAGVAHTALKAKDDASFKSMENAKTAAGQDTSKDTESFSSSTEAAQEAGQILAEITGILGVIKEGYSLIKQIVEAINDSDSMTDTEKGSKSVGIVKQALSAGKSTISTINAFMSHLGHVTTAMAHAVPGLSMGISVLDSIMQGINIGTSYISYKEMRGEKRDKKSSLRDRALSHFRKKAEGMSPVQRKKLEVQEFGQEINAEDSGKKSGIAGFFGGNISGKVWISYLKKNSVDAKEEDDYGLNKNLQTLAEKRIKRGALNLVANLTSIAGDIATLSGVGAAVGTGLKAAGSGIKVIGAGVRMLKQAVKDKMGYGNTTEKKTAMYNKLVDQLVEHTVKAEGNESEEKKVTAEIEASGFSRQKMGSIMKTKKADTEKGKELYSEWVKAMKAR